MNVGVLTTGFDYPELDTVIMARPTKSLSLWYQIVGRAIRPSPMKERGWVVDLCGNLNRFGKVQDLWFKAAFVRNQTEQIDSESILHLSVLVKLI